MKIFDWFIRKDTPQDLLKKREDLEFMEQIKRMAATVNDGRLSNRGLSEYGAKKMVEERGIPSPLEKDVLLADGTFITFEEWKLRINK